MFRFRNTDRFQSTEHSVTWCQISVRTLKGLTTNLALNPEPFLQFPYYFVLTPKVQDPDNCSPYLDTIIILQRVPTN